MLAATGRSGLLAVRHLDWNTIAERTTRGQPHGRRPILVAGVGRWDSLCYCQLATKQKTFAILSAKEKSPVAADFLSSSRFICEEVWFFLSPFQAEPNSPARFWMSRMVSTMRSIWARSPSSACCENQTASWQSWSLTGHWFCSSQRVIRSWP